MTEKGDLTSGSVAGHLRRQATAFSLGLVAIFSFEAVDLFFISRLGDAPLAAVSFTFPIVWLVYGLGIGFEAAATICNVLLAIVAYVWLGHHINRGSRSRSPEPRP